MRCTFRIENNKENCSKDYLIECESPDLHDAGPQLRASIDDFFKTFGFDALYCGANLTVIRLHE